jgi:hypothetical protein
MLSSTKYYDGGRPTDRNFAHTPRVYASKKVGVHPC